MTAHFLQLCFALGSMPTQCLASVGTLIPKAKKGNRQIAALPSLYRVAIKHEREVLQDWEAKYAHPAFSFQSGQNCLHRVFVQAARAEMATSSTSTKASTGMVLFDMSNYYEGIDRNKLQKCHEQTGFPGPAATLSLRQYRAKRYLQLGHIAAKIGHPTKGILPGCGVATYHVQSYSGPSLSEYMTDHPDLEVNCHVDDLAISATAVQEMQVVHRLRAGSRDLRALVEEDLGCSIADEKTEVVGSSFALKRKIRYAIGLQDSTARADPPAPLQHQPRAPP